MEDVLLEAGKVFLGWNKQRAQGLKVLLAQGLAPYLLQQLWRSVSQNWIGVQKSRRPFRFPA